MFPFLCYGFEAMATVFEEKMEILVGCVFLGVDFFDQKKPVNLVRTQEQFQLELWKDIWKISNTND